jgi:hypothetical protein
MSKSVQNVVIGLFVMVGALSPLACSGADADVGNSEVSGQDQALLAVGACVRESAGGPTSCKPADTWKRYASDTCASRGLDLEELALGAACAGGFVEAKYACCKSAPKPLPPKPAPVPVPAPIACFGDAQGGPTSCKPVAVWKQYADDACRAKGAQVTAIDYADECAKGSFRWTKYECCDARKPPPPPPPPPPACDWRDSGPSLSSCKDPVTWKQFAIDACKADGLSLGDISLPTATCGPAGQVGEIKFSCCK